MAIPSPVGKIIFLLFGVVIKILQEPISLLRTSIFVICFFTDMVGSERPITSTKKKLALTTSGKPMSDILWPYTPASFLYVCLHFSVSKTRSESTIGLPEIAFPHSMHINDDNDTC